MKRIGILPVLAAVMAVGIMLTAGCNAAKKPAPQNPPGVQVPAPAAPSGEPMPTNPDEVNKIAANLSNVASQVPGVNGVTVVIAGTTAYVGVDQKAGVEQSDTENIKRDVSNAVKKAEPRLTSVYVSSDPDTVTRLRRIADGITAGKPISAFDNELAEIAKRISPTAR